MNKRVVKNEFYYPSKDGATQIHAIEGIPDGKVAAVLQMCHGMVEHIDRYDEFARFLAEKGYYVVGHDHLGHGKSVTSKDKLGFFHESKGNTYVIGDIHHLRKITKKKYKDVPYFMLGHSMGSFLLRQYLGLYGDGISGAIVMGTGSKSNLLLTAGKVLCRIIAFGKGWEYRSKLVNNMAFGGFNKKFSQETNGSDWLSRNPVNSQKYAKDPLCSFVFTVNAYYQMFCGILAVNHQEKNGKIPKTLPIFLVAGKDSPVGNFGKSVENIYKNYKSCGIEDVSMKLYENDRHEILNEVDRSLVFDDLLTWMEKRKR